jgi:hypothetical protein
MLDIRYVAHHADEVAANCQRRGVAADVQGLVDAYLERNKTLVQLEALRAAANVVAQQTARLQMSSDAFLAAIPGVIDVLPDVELPPRPTERPWLVAFGKALKLAVGLRQEKESQHRPRVTIDDPCNKGQIDVRLQQIHISDGGPPGRFGQQRPGPRLRHLFQR